MIITGLAIANVSVISVVFLLATSFLTISANFAPVRRMQVGLIISIVLLCLDLAFGGLKLYYIASSPKVPALNEKGGLVKGGLSGVSESNAHDLDYHRRFFEAVGFDMTKDHCT